MKKKRIRKLKPAIMTAGNAFENARRELLKARDALDRATAIYTKHRQVANKLTETLHEKERAYSEIISVHTKAYERSL